MFPNESQNRNQNSLGTSGGFFVIVLSMSWGITTHSIPLKNRSSSFIEMRVGLVIEVNRTLFASLLRAMSKTFLHRRSSLGSLLKFELRRGGTPISRDCIFT